MTVGQWVSLVIIVLLVFGGLGFVAVLHTIHGNESDSNEKGIWE